MELLSKAGNAILNLVFPQACHVCSAPVNDIQLGIACAACWDATSMFDGSESICGKCGAPGNTRTGMLSSCHLCDLHHYDAARSLGRYERALSATVLNLKRVPVLPRILIDRLEKLNDQADITTCDAILPVPLSKKRIIDRGFNQAEIISNMIGKCLSKPVDSHSLTRKVDTPMHRAAMDRKARELTVKNAFTVKRPKLIEGKRILLVDDILTSGATASNCAKVLKKAGTASVCVFTLARTL